MKSETESNSDADFPSTIHLHFLFINADNEFSHRIQDSLSLHDIPIEEEKTLPFSVFISKIKSFEKYRLDSSFLFHIHETDLDKFSNMTSEDIQHHYFKPLPFLNDLSLSSSLPLFHPLSTLFFLMREKAPKSSLPKLSFQSDDESVLASLLNVSNALQKTKRTRPDTRRRTVRMK